MNLEKKIKDFYTNELEVKKENEGPYKASFFDLQTEVHNIKCATKLSKIKKMPFSFTPVAYLIWMAICRLKYFMHHLLLKFFVLPRQQQT